jgi:hypothetical protein
MILILGPLPTTNQICVAYLDVWQRDVIYLEDPHLSDKGRQHRSAPGALVHDSNAVARSDFRALFLNLIKSIIAV